MTPTGALVALMNNTTDGDYQTYRGEDVAFLRKNFFGRDPRVAAMVADIPDDQLWALKRGGMDYRKLYSAYRTAVSHTGQPTVILAKTIKGWSLGQHFESRNATHQMKKLSLEDLRTFRDRLQIPISDDQLDKYLPPYYKPGPDDPQTQYMMERRAALGGSMPRRQATSRPLAQPAQSTYDIVTRGSGKQEVATTMTFVRLFKDLTRDPEIGYRFVPIIPDEARTFGMDALFPTLKIYNPKGQNYLSVDRELMLSYKEATNGQILHEGIDEAGSVASFAAVGSSYSTHDQPMIPVYIFYSMFGFQRTADSFWLAGDQMVRGFVMGATAGRTTLNGEGLQHEDGHSHIIAMTNPAVVAYDPAYAYEIGYIVQDGLRRMYGEDSENVFFYITLYNEPYVMPPQPEGLDVDGLLRGMYLLNPSTAEHPLKAQILASGVGVPWALKAQGMLAEQWGVAADVWSVTSWTELRKDGLASDKHNLFEPTGEPTRALRDDAPRGPARPGRGRLGLHARPARPDPQVGPGRLRHPGHRRVRHVRHPRGAASALPGRCRVDRRADAALPGRARRDRPRGRPRGAGPLPPVGSDGRRRRQHRGRRVTAAQPARPAGPRPGRSSTCPRAMSCARPARTMWPPSRPSMRAVDIAGCGHSSTNIEEVSDELADPDCGWEYGSATVWRGADLVGAVFVFDGLASGRGWMLDVYARPGDPRARGDPGRAHRRRPARGPLPVGRAVHGPRRAAADREGRLLRQRRRAARRARAAGLPEVRRYWRMKVDHWSVEGLSSPPRRTPRPDPAVAGGLPGGIVIRPVPRIDESDWRGMHAASSAAFLDHFDFTPLEFDTVA